MSSDKSPVRQDINDKDKEFKGPGRRLGTSEGTKETTKNDTKVAKDEVVKEPIQEKSKDEADEGSEGVIVDVSDISDSELPIHNQFGAPPPPHNAGKPIKKKKVTGLRSEAKTLYEGPRKCSCCVNWVEKPPADAHAAMKSSAEHGDFALLVRRTAHGQDRAWNIQSMMIYSPYIMEMLRTTLKDYPGVATALDQLSMDAPFEPLLHRWNLIDEALKEEDDLKARNHYNLFRQVVEPELKPHLRARDECEEHAVIPFASLWTILKPGDLVWWEADGQGVIGRMVEAHFSKNMMGSELYNLTCEQVDWNGEKFGIQKIHKRIDSFEGTRPVIGLSVIPLRFKPDAEEIRNQCLNRGRKFEALHGYHFKAYDGPALGFADGAFGLRRPTSKKIVDRVVIDANSYYHFQEMEIPSLYPMDPIKAIAPHPYHSSQSVHPQLAHQQLAHQQQLKCMAPQPGYLPPPQPHHPGRGRRSTKRYMPDESSYTDQGPAEVKPLTEEQLILCVPWAKGFVLKEKKWYQLAVDCIKDITWNDSFSNLVLPHQEKDLLLAFAQSKINASANDSNVQVFDDFVDGKGRGVIILLSGSPGVGKTLTAESIAEKMKVPLYTLSAGEIGIMPSTVETEIKAALEKCAKWNAILLLDEADVFLEKRELNSLKRNELVSIFLRLLEYYEGMMFLTTNRVSTIDPAFESRIDVSINYPDLTAELRFQIWTKFLFRSEQIRSGLDLSENDLGPLARLNLNGRQIKSAIKTAQLLATSKGEKLAITHLNAVLKLHRSLT